MSSYMDYTAYTPMKADRLDLFDTWTYILLGPIAMFCALSLFLGHLFSRRLRKMPGDLITMVAFSEIMLTFHWTVSAINTVYITKDDHSVIFCNINSVIAVIGASLETTYNISFLLYIAVEIHDVRKFIKNRFIFHGVPLTVSFLTLFQSLIKGNMGRNQYGTCSLKHMSHLGLALGISSLVGGSLFGIWVYYKTAKTLENPCPKLLKIRQNFNNYYARYIRVLFTLWMLIFFAYLCQNSGVNQTDYANPFIEYTLRGYFFNLGKLANVAKILLPIYLFLIRTEDPSVKEIVWGKFIKNKGNRENTIENIARENALTSDSEAGNNSEFHSEFQSNNDDLMWMNLLSKNNRESLYRTLFAAIKKYYPPLLENSNSPNSQSNSAIIYSIDGKEMMNDYQNNLGSILDCVMTVYASSNFSKIKNTSYMNKSYYFDMENSLDLNKNQKKLEEAAIDDGLDGKGGKSGSFFLKTWDKKFIIKSITKKEGDIFMKILEDYTRHLSTRKDSQIARIFGFFDFQFTHKTIRIIVMENLEPRLSEGILRKYDLKGSSLNRSSLDRYDDIGEMGVVIEVMKDNDFREIEKFITLESDSYRFLQTNIGADVHFFESLKIIDYSLIVIVVDKNSLGEEFFYEQFELENNHIIETENYPNIAYFIGIIDYFQHFDLGKRSERFAKRLTRCNCNLETSTQPPKKYAARFMREMKKYFVRQSIMEP